MAPCGEMLKFSVRTNPCDWTLWVGNQLSEVCEGGRADGG